MKKTLYLLMLTMIIVVSSELQVPAMMSEMAEDLDVDTGRIGLLVSIFALGMALGGPVIAYALRHRPPKQALLTVVAAYAVPEMLVPVVHEYWWVVLMRILTGCLAGAAVGLSIVYATRLAPSTDKIGEAVSIVLSGIMVGTVVGLPVSHFIAGRWKLAGHLLHSRRCRPGRIRAQPPHACSEERRQCRRQCSGLAQSSSPQPVGALPRELPDHRSRIRGVLLLHSSSRGQRRFGADATTLILLAYGLCALVGNLIVGKLADKHAVGVLRFGHALLFVSLGVLALAGQTQPLVLTMVLVVGLAGVSMNPPLVTRVVEIGGTGNLVSTFHTSVITLGITAGTALSALTISMFGNDPAVAMWTGSAFALLAAVTLALQRGRTRAANDELDRPAEVEVGVS